MPGTAVNVSFVIVVVITVEGFIIIVIIIVGNDVGIFGIIGFSILVKNRLCLIVIFRANQHFYLAKRSHTEAVSSGNRFLMYKRLDTFAFQSSCDDIGFWFAGGNINHHPCI